MFGSPKLPLKIELKTQDGEIIFLEKKPSAALHGESTKALYHGNTITLAGEYKQLGEGAFFAKLTKPRKAIDIFTGSLANLSPDELAKYNFHVRRLVQKNAFLEVLSPQIAKAIFNSLSEFIIIPENYFCIYGDKEKDDSYPFILSKSVGRGFDEFLTRVTAVQGAKTSGDHKEKKPLKRDELKLLTNLKDASSPTVKLSIEQTEVLGKLYYVALLMMHWDIFNTINLSNSGCMVDEDKHLHPVIVDWGNSMGVGFLGVSADQTSFKNPAFPSSEGKPGLTGLAGFEHTVPFDGVVYPILPRMLVPDLFEMTGKDELSKAMLKGFKEAHRVAMPSLENLAQRIKSSIEIVLQHYTAAQDVSYVREKLLETSFYFPKDDNKNDYTLVNVMRERIHSLDNIIKELDKGNSMENIAATRFNRILSSQLETKEQKQTTSIKIRSSL